MNTRFLKTIAIENHICYSWHIQTVGIYGQKDGEMMTISERLFAIMKEKNVSMPNLSRMTGISRHTIFDWQRRGTNPGADKIMVICEALEITPEELLVGTTDTSSTVKNVCIDTVSFEAQIIESCQNFSDEQKRRLLAYVSMLQNMKNE